MAMLNRKVEVFGYLPQKSLDARATMPTSPGCYLDDPSQYGQSDPLLSNPRRIRSDNLPGHFLGLAQDV